MKTKKGHSFSAKLMSVAAIAFMLFVASCEKDDPTPVPQATCDDGIQNGDETGIDCGGSCTACVTMAAPNLNSGVIDMEEDGMGPDFSSDNENNADNPSGTWGVFGFSDGNKIQLEIVDNPNTTGNASAKVLKIVEQADQQVWQGFFFDLDSKVTLSEPNTAISVDVHSVREGQVVSMKLEDSANSSANTGDIKVSTTGTGWETVTFNLDAASHSGVFDRIVFIMDFADTAESAVTTHYIDNIRLSEPGEDPEEPTVNVDGSFDANFGGAFGGTTAENDVYSFPTAAETWAGWANETGSIYPLGFPNGGTITFTASSAGADAGIYFRFERLPYNENDPNATEPSFNTAEVTVSGSEAKEYTIAIDAQDAANTYSSALMYFTVRDVEVTITNIKINPGASGETTTSVNTSGTFSPNYDGVFGNVTLEEGGVYTFPSSAESWGGWANTNPEIYPLGFPNGGTITFTASAAADAGIYFRFERLPYDENDSNATEPSFNTEEITISGETATEYTITIEAQDAANTYSSGLMYLTTRDVAVTITDIKINL
ncbi:MAG: hypothetical protein ACPGRT_04410 [Flavobacteriaceae bacterium]|jgi:hypothetical protein